jgi:uncharacterized protein with HEPN domain
VKDDRLYLGHILEAAERIVLYGRDGEESFRTDLRTQDAIIRNLHPRRDSWRSTQPR